MKWLFAFVCLGLAGLFAAEVVRYQKRQALALEDQANSIGRLVERAFP